MVLSDYEKDQLKKMIEANDTKDMTNKIRENKHSIKLKEGIESTFLQIVNEDTIYEYEDPFSSINIHYAMNGQELGWHFDNSSFAVTLLLQKPPKGGIFEYVKNVRDADSGEMGYETVTKIINGQKKPSVLEFDPGTLVLFRGFVPMHL